MARSWIPVTGLASGWVAGIGLQLQQPVLWQAWAYGVACLCALLLAWWGLRAVGARAFLWPAAALLAAWGMTGVRAIGHAADQLPQALEGRNLVVTGRVTGLPQWQEDGTRFTLQVDGAESDGQPVVVPDVLALGWYLPRHAGPSGKSGTDVAVPASTAEEGDATPATRCRLCVWPGQRWRMTVRLRQPHGNRNPSAFDYELWLWEQGIGANGYVRVGKQDAPPQLLDQPAWHDSRAWLDRARLHVREHILHTLAGGGVTAAETGSAAAGTVSPQRTAGVLAALVMGDQAAIERQDWDIFRMTGVAHLMSISGLHVTMFAWLAGMAVGGFWRRSARWGWTLCLRLPAPMAALWGGVLLAGGYALFSGWGVPAQRTVCMLAVVALLRSLGRQWPWHAIWATAGAAVLAWDPWALLQAGFWLSFVAVGVLFATDRRGHVVPAATAGQRLRQGALHFLHEQWTVLLALTPLTLLMFGQVSVVGFVANAVAVPLVTLVVTPLAMSGVAWHALWEIAGWCLQGLFFLLTWLAQWPWASYQTALAPWWVGLLGVAGGVLLSMPWPWPWRMAGLLWLGPVLLWQSPRPAAGEFDVLAADIGQGSAVLVRTARHTLVYDAGPVYGRNSNAGQRVLLPLLAALDHRPDMIMLSHSDTDHVGGAEALMRAFPQAAVVGSIEEDHELQQIRPVARCLAGMQWQWDGVVFEVLHPLPEAYAQDLPTNAMSCVVRIRNATTAATALLTGDIEAEQEAGLVQRSAPGSLRADLLLAAHHGSKTSSTAAWLDAVQPGWTLIQHGYRNRYQHPHAVVLQRMQAAGTKVVQTDQCGAAWWDSASRSLRCERQAHMRYWQHHVPLPAALAASAPSP